MLLGIFHFSYMEVTMKKEIVKPCVSICTGLLLFIWLFPVAVSASTAMFVQGNNHVIEQQYDEALSAYDDFLKENPEHYLVPAARWTMANIYFSVNEDYENAAVLYNRIIDENADTEWELFAFGRLGACYEAQEKWQEAADVLQTAASKFSDSEELDVRTRVDQMRGSIISCYRNLDDHESLIRVYKEMLAEDPAAPSAPQNQFELAQIYLEMEALNHAAKNFVAVVDRYPASPVAQRVQSEHGEFLASQCDYDWIPFTTYVSSVEISRAGHYDEARAQFDEVLTAKHNTDMAYAVRFQKELLEFRKNGDAAAFMAKLESSVDDYPYGYGGVSAEGMHAVLQRIIGAQEDAAANPDDAGAYVGMGWAYYQAGAYESAIGSAEQGIAHVPDSPDLYNMLGYCYINLQRFDDAITTFEQLVAVAPDDPNSYDSMAECYYTSGDTLRAIELYQQSLAVDATFTNPYYMLGRIYSEIDQPEKAQKYLEHYLELAPDGYQAQNAQNVLNEMEQGSNLDN